jgi:hypothetical protein
MLHRTHVVLAYTHARDEFCHPYRNLRKATKAIDSHTHVYPIVPMRRRTTAIHSRPSRLASGTTSLLDASRSVILTTVRCDLVLLACLAHANHLPCMHCCSSSYHTPSSALVTSDVVLFSAPPGDASTLSSTWPPTRLSTPPTVTTRMPSPALCLRWPGRTLAPT